MVVTVKLDDGKEQGVGVGVDNSFDSTLYVQKTGDATIRVAAGYGKSSLDRSAFELRNKKVAHLEDSAEVKRVEVSGVKKPYTLEKDGANWKLGSAPADTGAADRVVNAVKSMRATAVASEEGKNLAQVGLDKPRISVKLGVAAGKDTFTRSVFVGQGKGGAVSQETSPLCDDSPDGSEVVAQPPPALDT